MLYFAFIMDLVQEMALVSQELEEFNIENKRNCKATFERHRHNHAMRIDIQKRVQLLKMQEEVKKEVWEKETLGVDFDDWANDEEPEQEQEQEQEREQEQEPEQEQASQIIRSNRWKNRHK